jgi:hypothetical protein
VSAVRRAKQLGHSLPQLPLGGKWSPEEALVLDTLMDDCQGRYQICGPNAFNRYGFDEQIPTRVYSGSVTGNRTGATPTTPSALRPGRCLVNRSGGAFTAMRYSYYSGEIVSSTGARRLSSQDHEPPACRMASATRPPFSAFVAHSRDPQPRATR